jgi:hypothetical protein
MASIPDIIKDLGGATAIAAKTGIPLTTVHSWKRASFVPAWRVPTLVDLAEKAGKPYTAADFPTTRPVADPAIAA